MNSFLFLLICIDSINEPSFLTIKLHHGGSFVHSSTKGYIDEKAKYFDYTNSITINLSNFKSMIEQCSYA